MSKKCPAFEQRPGILTLAYPYIRESLEMRHRRQKDYSHPMH